MVAFLPPSPSYPVCPFGLQGRWTDGDALLALRSFLPLVHSVGWALQSSLLGVSRQCPTAVIF